ncbi:transcription termination factor MTEF1, chloroplastic [Macadamia integrifolia]|uniref:transcription termination factor MTEF1, chloroplastic n=1 Tax=Macadamia integrifolia TaxID=60698 RepID=UPI001C5273D2|nr:transcription termination factor MTEF1, chloroplastic [Macadamia integrifolia]
MPILLQLQAYSLHFPTVRSFSSNPSSSSYTAPLFLPSSPSTSSSSLTSGRHPPLLLRFRTSYRENLRYLRALGIISNRDVPSSETLQRILSILNFFKSKGFSEPDFRRLYFLCPQLFSPSVDPTDFAPVFDFLATDVAASPAESCGLILRCPGILLSHVDLCLRRTLLFLRELGLEKLNLPTSLNAHLLNTRVDKLEAKVKFLQSLGFSHEESSRACSRLPAIFGYSIENNMRPKFKYLVIEMERDIQELKEFPQYFAFSLEKRIMPRHLHLKERNVRIPLQRMLLWSDGKFYTKWK